MFGINKLRAVPLVTRDHDLMLAQERVVKTQIPWMYTILIANMFALAFTHQNAPILQSIIIPGILSMACAARIILWWFRRWHQTDPSRVRRQLMGTVIVAAVFGIAFSFWAISLLPYGDAYQRSQVAFFISITGICCMFCMQQLRAAALAIAITSFSPLIVVFLLSDNPIFMVFASNVFLVICALISIILGSNRDFAELVHSRSEMHESHAETKLLLDINYRLANEDQLTGLPNVHAFNRHLDETLSKAQSTQNQIGLLRLNLDGFKSINAIFGQITGDRVLREVARRIDVLRRPYSFLAHTGSDNFVLLMDGPVDEASLVACGEVLTKAMRLSFDLDGTFIHLSASVGMALSQATDTPDALFDRADYATSIAKREARGTAVLFAEHHADEIFRQRQLEHALHTAVLEDEIQILFQPQFDVVRNRTTGYEVLARWHSPALGEVSPALFIPLAERMGIVSRITQVVMRKALAISAQLPNNIRLSVNLSANDLGSMTATEAIVDIVEAAGKPCRIDFEITETAVMHDLAQANTSLVILLSLGSRIALDDFGTGHSSLTHVQKLPLDRIKVDRSFVAEIIHDETSRTIIKTTIDLCRNLGISCVFEGVETEEQLEALIAIGGTVMQGYLFGRPMPAEKMLEEVATPRRRAAPAIAAVAG
jgi:diguanylate cyclase (GGDEF)-like protein